MNTQTLKLQKTDSEFIKVAGNCVEVDGRRWYYLPYWYEEIGDGLFIERRYEDIPERLKTMLMNERTT
jgi:hypothetical protein